MCRRRSGCARRRAVPCRPGPTTLSAVGPDERGRRPGRMRWTVRWAACPATDPSIELRRPARRRTASGGSSRGAHRRSERGARRRRRHRPPNHRSSGRPGRPREGDAGGEAPGSVSGDEDAVCLVVSLEHVDRPAAEAQAVRVPVWSVLPRRGPLARVGQGQVRVHDRDREHRRLLVTGHVAGRVACVKTRQGYRARARQRERTRRESMAVACCCTRPAAGPCKVRWPACAGRGGVGQPETASMTSHTPLAPVERPTLATIQACDRKPIASLRMGTSKPAGRANDAPS